MGMIQGIQYIEEGLFSIYLYIHRCHELCTKALQNMDVYFGIDFVIVREHSGVRSQESEFQIGSQPANEQANKNPREQECEE